MNKASLLLLCLSLNANAAKVRLIQEAPAAGTIQIRTGVFPFRQKHKFEVKPQAVQTFDLGHKKPAVIDLELTYTPPAFNRNDIQPPAHYAARIRVPDRVKRARLDVWGLVEKLDCTGLIDVEKSGDTTIVDLGTYNGLKCEPRTKKSRAKLADLDPSMIGSRGTEGKRGVGANWFSLDQDAAFGAQFISEFNAQNERYILPENDPITRFYQERMEQIAAVSDLQRFKPKVHIVKADIMNAFALPGGGVYVFTGLLDRARTESEVLGVLGHEWGHVVARHGTRNMSRTLRVLLGLTLGDAIWAVFNNTGKDTRAKRTMESVRPLVMQLAQVGGVLHLLNKSRQAEAEADRLGSQYNHRIGFDPAGVAAMFQVFKGESGSSYTTLEEILSTHPHHDKRISAGYGQAHYFIEGAKDKYLLTTNDYEQVAALVKAIPSYAKADAKTLGFAFTQSLHRHVVDTVAYYATHEDELGSK